MEKMENDKQNENDSKTLLEIEAENATNENLLKQQKEIDELKKEIRGQIEVKKKKRIQWGSTVITFILLILTSVAAIQAYESMNILNIVNSNSFTTGSGSNAPAPAAGTESLPNMVGGC